MKTHFKIWALTAITILLLSASSNTTPTIYFVGDSTMADYDVNVYTGTTEQRGWGQMFRQFLVGDISFVNAARNGRSSKSFYRGSDSLWAGVRSQLKAGDYVFVQFAHNDEKGGGLVAADGIGTDPWGEYQEYLRRYVREARAIGAIPILVTPIVRKYFSGTTITYSGCHNLATDDSTLNYPRAMKAVAREMSVPLIDLTTKTKALVESYGSTTATSVIYCNGDNTHLKAAGGTLFARLAVQDMIQQNILTQYLNPSPDMLISPSALDFGKCYISTYTESSFSVSAMDLTPTAGSITVSASDGFAVSNSSAGNYSASLTLDYTSGNLSATTIYVRFIPTTAQAYSGSISISNPAGDPKTVSVTGTGLSLTGGVPAKINFLLSANATPTVTGPIVSLGASWSGMYVKNYAVPSSSTTWPAGAASGTTQRNSIIGDAWPAGEIDILPTRYIQFAVQPAAGTSFTVDSIGVYAGVAGGSGLRFRVMMAKKADFSDGVALEERLSNASATMYALSYKQIVEVDESEGFYLRFYPWYNGAATLKYLCLQNLTIKGQVATKPVIQSSQEITFGSLPVKTYGDAPFSLSAMGGASGNAVTYTSSNTAVASISGSTVSIVGAGTSIITASQAGNTSYYDAIPVSQTLTVLKSSQSISFSNVSSKVYGDTPFEITAYASSSKTIEYSLLSGPASISGKVITINGAGEIAVLASQNGNDNYDAASNSILIKVDKASQTLVFDKAIWINDSLIEIHATASSNKAVDYSIISNIASIAGNLVSVSGAGTIQFIATQSGDANYMAASTSVNFVVAKTQAYLKVAALGSKTYGDSSFILKATSKNPNPILSTNLTPDVISIQNNTITIKSAGLAQIRLNQAASANYLATDTSIAFSINKAVLKVAAVDTFRSQGKHNPVFRLIYSGIVGTDNFSDIDIQPTALCVADSLSPVGIYPITVSGGSDSDYSFEYTAASLTVKALTSNKSANNQTFTIYPNPSSGVFYIKSNNSEKFSFEIYNSWGFIVLKSNSCNEFNSIDLTPYPAGIYILNVISTKHSEKLNLIKN